MSEKDKLDIDKGNDSHPINYNSPNMPSDWRFNGVDLPDAPIGLVPSDRSIAVCSSSCSTTSMVDSFGQTLWDHPINSQNMGFCEINIQNPASTSNAMGVRSSSPVFLRNSADRPLDMAWNPPSSMMKGGMFLSNAPGMLPHALPQFPSDSAFIERAARFSSFNGGNFGDMVNPFSIPESTGIYSRGSCMLQGPHDAFAENGLKKLLSGGQSQKNELKIAGLRRDGSLLVGNEAIEGSLPENDRNCESLARSHEEAKQGIRGSIIESDEAEFSGGGDGDGRDHPSGLEGTGMQPSAQGLNSKKRKRVGQDNEPGEPKEIQQPRESVKVSTEYQEKGDQYPAPTANKTTGKYAQQGSQASDPSKEEYIHVRARRGQATNSHSLAERVRREKISERMKFLQDLVPGCSKVTGKAVMLDEIINYVQSLQRQVEFLSMKLATVNPQMDFNTEGLLVKDILQARTGPSCTLGYLPDSRLPMAYPLHPSQPALIPAMLPGNGSCADVIRRTINSQLPSMSGAMSRGFKEPTQLSNVWEDELHNVIQMSYGTGALHDNPEANEPPSPADLKVEH